MTLIASSSKPHQPKKSRKEEDKESSHSNSNSSSDQEDDNSGSGSEDDEISTDEEGDEDEIKTLNRNKHGNQTHRKLVCEEEDRSDQSDETSNHISQTTKKRKRRATSPTTFGTILSQAIESSKTSNAHGPATSLTQSSRAALKQAKKDSLLESNRKRTASKRHELQERGHIKDVIGGWTPRPALPFSEWLVGRKGIEIEMVGGVGHEKVLRRLAQTGVVKLFNAIRAAQNVVEDEAGQPFAPVSLSGAQKRKLNKLAGSKPLEKSVEHEKEEKDQTNEGLVSKTKSNVLGSRGKEQALSNLSKISFLELIKSSGMKKPI
ncbi:uncharacterized protein MELLADRAFT_60183 [Melampsora larici-populina 98AG31]|uniref:Rrp15p-domain-containing protein n=1 Tax=Melampsora larici-populina (strain 98AG31 / pathotype 3-4-7) TaxID=747676 RepID=F4RAD9_MELLP|nr:uncharacterized protein MELLADRAFT_60183 [Melampsora larici-populina 98AG31]EGG10463.1 hypothetical protein MELLADRAFT_60183 [Melampsora larici-populina 98AG31]